MASRINLLSLAQGNLRLALDRPVSREQLDFLNREIIPRLFAASIACLALVQAVAHAALSTTHFVTFLIALPLAEREAYLAIFNRARSYFFYFLDDASVGVLIFHGLWDPEQVIEAAFPTEMPEIAPPHISLPEAPLGVESMQSALLAEELHTMPTIHRAESPNGIKDSPPKVETTPQPEAPIEQPLLMPTIEELLPKGRRFSDGKGFDLKDSLSNPALKDRDCDKRSVHSEEPLPSEPSKEEVEQPVKWVGFDEPSSQPPIPAMPQMPVSLPQEAVSRAEIQVHPVEAPPPSLPSVVNAAPRVEPAPPQDPYVAIVEPEGYGADVAQIMEVLDKAWTSSLASKKGKSSERLMEVGTRVKNHGLHTLKFLECIVRNPSARKHLASVQNGLTSGLKWRGFLWGESLKREKGEGTGGMLDALADKNQLEPYLDGFLRAVSKHKVNVSRQELLSFFAKRDWEGMFKRLLSN